MYDQRTDDAVYLQQFVLVRLKATRQTQVLQAIVLLQLFWCCFLTRGGAQTAQNRTDVSFCCLHSSNQFCQV